MPELLNENRMMLQDPRLKRICAADASLGLTLADEYAASSAKITL